VDSGTISKFSFAKHFARHVFPFQVKLSVLIGKWTRNKIYKEAIWAKKIKNIKCTVLFSYKIII